jgi:hypothetical protein
MTSTATSATRNGPTSRAKSAIDTPAIRQQMYIAIPTGGVTRPIMQPRVSTTPKCTGSTPIARSPGVRMGVSTIRMVPASMKQPRKRTRALISIRTTAGELDTV